MNSTLESENATLDVDVSEPKRFGRFVRSLYTFNASKPGHSPSDLTFRRGDSACFGVQRTHAANCKHIWPLPPPHPKPHRSLSPPTTLASPLHRFTIRLQLSSTSVPPRTVQSGRAAASLPQWSALHETASSRECKAIGRSLYAATFRTRTLSGWTPPQYAWRTLTTLPRGQMARRASVRKVRYMRTVTRRALSCSFIVTRVD